MASNSREPGQIANDSVDETGVFGIGVGVVESQIAPSAELFGKTEVEGDRLCMTDVEIAVRLRRKPGLNTSTERALVVVASDQLTDEIGSLVLRCAHSDPSMGRSPQPPTPNSPPTFLTS